MSGMPEWRAGVEAVHTESEGLLSVELISLAAVMGILISSATGGFEAFVRAKIALETIEWVRRAPRKAPVLCACCPRAIRRITPGTRLATATPSNALATSVLGFIICDRCAADEAAAFDKAVNSLRRMWPDYKPTRVTHPAGGRA